MAAEEGEGGGDEHPARSQYQQMFDVQAEERQNAQEQHCVVDQDDGDVHLEPADGEARRRRTTSARSATPPACRPQLRTLERLLLAG